MHPVVTTALAGNAGAWLYGLMVGASYDASLTIYYSKVGQRCELRFVSPSNTCSCCHRC